MTLFIDHGPHLGPLADQLADRLSTPPDDPFEPVVVAVPTAGVRDWLSRRLAERLGISANILMPFPGRFLAAALGAPLDADDPWDVDRLTWAVLDVLDSERVDVPGWRRASSDSPSRRYATARRIADLFDRYATNRPQVLQQWQRGAIGDGTVRAAAVGGIDGASDDDQDRDLQLVGGLDPSMTWQFHLWRAVRARIGTPSPAERLPELVDQIREGALDPALPSFVAMFGIGTISPAQLDIVSALAAVRDVHLAVIHPSPVRWHETPPLDAGRLMPRRRFDRTDTSRPTANDSDAAGQRHPLLHLWGRLSMETAAVLRGAEPTAAVAGAPVEPDRPPVSLLEHIQRDIRLGQAPTPYVVAGSDSSIQVHACHGATRQLEVLRDVLGHLFCADPALEPSDVLVVCPDLARFEPFAKAVFARGTLPVPLGVSDLSLGADNPVAAALAAVVRTVADRCAVADVLAVAALEPVRQRLGIATDDLDHFGTWTDRLGTSWGLDTEHRSAWLDLDIDAGTWDASLRALLVGAAMPAPEPRATFGGIVPDDDIGADDLRRAGRLAELITRLRRTRHLLSGRRAIGEWCDVLVDVLGLMCATAPADAWQMRAVLDAIESVRETSLVSGTFNSVALDHADIRAVVDALVAGRPGRLQLRSGRVTMTGMVPVRNVPAKVICLLGFDEVSLRPPGVDGDDLLALRPCVGERDRRAEQRQLVLDAVMAAGQHLVVTCDGNDITTNHRVRFPVQLAELLDVIEATVAGHADGSAPTVLVHHPLRAFDERNFRHGGVPTTPVGVFGFDDTMRVAAEVRRAATDATAAVLTPLRWSITGAIPPRVDLAQLTEACTRPARTLLREGLDVRLPGDVDSLDASIPLAASPLDKAGMGRRLLERYRAAANDSDDGDEIVRVAMGEWRRSEALHAGNPPRRLIDQSLDEVAAEVAQLITAATTSELGLPSIDVMRAGGSLGVDVTLRYTGRAVGVSATDVAAATPSGELRLVDTVAGIAGSTICRLSYRRPKQRVVVGAAIDLAAAVVASGHGEWQALTVTRGGSGATKPECHVLRVGAAEPIDAARTLLETAAELRVAALRGAVPLFEETSVTLHEKRFIDEELLRGGGFHSNYDLADDDNWFVWGSVTTADMLRLTPSPVRLARMMWNAVYHFADIATSGIKPGVKPGIRRGAR